MRRYLAGVCPILVAAGAHAAQAPAPQAGREYFSVQIASGDAAGLAQAYRRYTGLPYLRIEKRGKLMVLRAGFWAGAREAKAAIAGAPLEQPLIRTAVFRPEAIVQKNWQEGEAVAPSPAAATTTRPAPPAPLALSRELPPAVPAPSRGTVVADAAVPLEPPAPPASASSPAVPAQNNAIDANGELRPFNQEDFALAFDIFAGAGDLKRAYLVAEKAVAGAPDDLEWRLKLAHVAEWTQRPQVAWAQRDYMFRHGDRGGETLDALLRLAPVAPNYDTVIAVWQYKAAQGNLTPTQWTEVAQLFDLAARPRDGSLFFEAQFRKRGDAKFLAQAAQLSENAGDDERAYQLYRERLRLKPFSVDLALHAVVFLLRRDRARDAYDLMQEHAAEVPADALDFWRILAQTSWELSELNTAENAYRKYLGAAKNPDAADWSRLIALVRQRHPGEAAQLALEVYRRYDNLDYLIVALTLKTDANDFTSQARIFAGMSPAETAKAEKDNRFLVLRAQYYQGIGAPDRAWGDFRRALASGVQDSDVTVPALWFLIDTRRKAELIALLKQLEPAAQADSAYWVAFAAANHALDRYREAIYWYRRELARKPDDSLLALNYADALDRYQLTGVADRVRQQVWQRLRGQLQLDKPTVPLDPDPDLLAVTRLALLNRPGDPALALVREVAAQLRGLPTSTGDDRETRALIIAWAVSTEQFRNARAWMWLRYASSAAERIATRRDNFDPRRADRRGTPPLWAEIQTALQLNDTQTMDRLLQTHADGLPIYNRYDTAYALNHWQQALDIAFHGMEQSGVDDELHDRFRQHAPLYANYLQLQLSRSVYGDLGSRGLQVEGRYALTRNIQLKAGYTKNIQGTDDPEFNTLAPHTDRLTSLEAIWLQGEENSNSLAIFRHNEVANLTGARYTLNYRFDRRFSLDGAVEYRGNATESIPLRVAGYTNNVRFGLSYNLSKREYVRIAPQYDRFYTQFGDYVGSATQVETEAGYRIRTEYPDLRARVFATRQLVNRNGAIGPATIARLPQAVRDAIGDGSLSSTGYFLPDGSTNVGACLGGGENLGGVNLQDTYTRAWRPFFEACEQHNSVNGAGYLGYIGIAGSVIGPDHLSLRLDISRGGTGAGNFARTLALRYRYYF
ncbi:MAG TPA: tetratricopeptide repeat protein [Burkholderiales bacterium]